MIPPFALTTPDPRPNPFVDPTPFNRVRVAGLLILAVAVKFNGFKVEDTWKKQKSKESNGAVFSFGGTDPVGGEGGFSVTFRITSADEFSQLYDIYDALKPVPTSGGAAPAAASASPSTSTTKAVGSPPATAENTLASLQASLAALNSPPAPAATSAGESSSSSGATSATPDSPGPRPPTVPIELGWLAFLGVFAVARKHWDFSAIEPDKIEVTIGWVQDKPPTPAGAGAMSAPKPLVVTGFGGIPGNTVTFSNPTFPTSASGAAGT